MASLGRLLEVILDTSGNAISGVSVEVRRQGSTVVSGSDTTPITVTVNNPGAVVAGDTVVINTGTTSYDVDSVTATTVVLSGFLGTLTLADEDRISPTNDLVTLSNDAEADEGKSNPLTTDSAGTATAWVVGNAYDLHISGGGAATTLTQDRYVSGRSISANMDDTVNLSNYKFDTTGDLDSTTEAQHGAAFLPIHTEWVDNSTRLMTLHGVDSPCHLRVGDRAQTTLAKEFVGVYVSHDYTEDKASGEEINGIFALTQAGGDIASGANSSAIFGEFQYDPGDAKTATGSVAGISAIGKYRSTNAGSNMGILQGLVAQVRVDGDGTLANGRGLQVAAPTNTGSVGGPATIDQYTGLFVQGAVAGYATLNILASFDGASDESSDFAIHRSQVRIDDAADISNLAVDGRWVDIYRTWDGDTDDGSPLFTGMHISTDYTGTFTAGDDCMGLRLFVTTGETAGDGANMDQLMGLQVLMNHRSDQAVDDCVGVHVTMLRTGAGASQKNYGIEITPIAFTDGGGADTAGNYVSTGHIKFTPVSLATPATTLALMTGEAEGTMVFVTDSNNADNSGLYLFMGGAWHAWTPGGVGAAADA